MLITDPRYFVWLFNIEQEIRKNIPIAYLNIWDDYPAPMYNKPYYEACDLLMGISKQTVNINQLVLGDKGKNKLFKYVPHGLNHNVYKPVEENDPELKKFKKEFFGNDNPDFVLFFNSRNIRRKQIPDAMLAFRAFLDSLPKEKADKCQMVLHTEIVSEHGTDLAKVKEYFFNESYPNAIKFSTQKLSSIQLNYLYNIADAQILLTSNEGWGLTITEAILAGTPIIANVTGGMQDQMIKQLTPQDDIVELERGETIMVSFTRQQLIEYTREIQERCKLAVTEAVNDAGIEGEEYTELELDYNNVIQINFDDRAFIKEIESVIDNAFETDDDSVFDEATNVITFMSKR